LSQIFLRVLSRKPVMTAGYIGKPWLMFDAIGTEGILPQQMKLTKLLSISQFAPQREKMLTRMKLWLGRWSAHTITLHQKKVKDYTKLNLPYCQQWTMLEMALDQLISRYAHGAPMTQRAI